MRIKVGRVSAITDNELVHRLAATDSALTLLEVVEERLLIIVSGRQVWHPKTHEQAPPAVADSLDHVLSDGGILRVTGGVLFQLCQEGLNFSLDLACLTGLTAFIFHPQETREFDDPAPVTASAATRGQVVTVHLGGDEQVSQQRMVVFF